MPLPEFPAADYAKDASLQELLTQLTTPISVSVDGGTVTVTATSLEISNDAGNPIPVSAADLPLPAGASTEATLEAVLAALGGTVDVAGPLTDAQLRAANVPVTVSNPYSGDVVDRAARLLGHVTVDAATIAALTDGSQRVGGTVGVDANAVATATTLAAGNITAGPAKLMGFTIRETAGATAVVRLRDSNAAGTMLATIALAASESVRDWFGPGGISAPTKIYCEIASGTVEGSVYSK